MQTQTYVRTLLFEGLEEAEIDEIYAQMRLRHFDAGACVCREGEQGTSLFVLQSGTAHVVIGSLQDANSQRFNKPLARLRRGDVVGEMSLLTGDPRSATVIARTPITVLELTREIFASILGRHPAIIANLSRILSRRLAHTNIWQAEHRRKYEVIALVVDQSGKKFVRDIIEATRATSQHSVAELNLSGSPFTEDGVQSEASLETFLASLDDVIPIHNTVIIAVHYDQKQLSHLLAQVDRTIAVVSETEAVRVASVFNAMNEGAEIFLLTEQSNSIPESIAGLRIVHSCELHAPERGIAWLGRHLARTKIGLALGAGGAKGYAHIAVIDALEQAGYTIDYVAGSSIGAIVGCWLAMGMHAADIYTAMQEFFAPDVVASMFKLSLSGLSTGYETVKRLCQETANNRTFDDLEIPLTTMAVDLNTRGPAPINEGPLWEALLAAISLPGMFPPYQRGGQRLVDGLSLIPVPTHAIAELGADITVSVNLISREILLATPDGSPPARSSGRMLETLLEVMDLAQMDASIRSAAEADVTITPRFGPVTWRDFHLADLFMQAGREAAEGQLIHLNALARPAPVA